MKIKLTPYFSKSGKTVTLRSAEDVIRPAENICIMKGDIIKRFPITGYLLLIQKDSCEVIVGSTNDVTSELTENMTFLFL